MKELNNKRVWITGASGGIGKEMAIQMANAGAKLIITARSIEKLEALKESLDGDEHLICPMDLSKTDEIPGTVDKVITKVEKIDVLVNNAGISQRSLVKDTHLEVDRKIMELDYFSKVTLTKTLLPHMIKNQGGLIISISSVAGKIGTPMRSAYCAAKHALIGFMDALRAEVHANNIKVMVVTPGSVQTDISKNALEGDGKKHNIIDPMIANGIPVDVCVKKIIKGIQNDTPELMIAQRRERMAVYVRRFFPALLFKMMTKLQAT